MKDLLGNDLQVGDHVVYASRRSSSVGWRAGCVLEVLERGVRLKTVAVYNGKLYPQRDCVVRSPVIKIVPTQDLILELL